MQTARCFRNSASRILIEIKKRPKRMRPTASGRRVPGAKSVSESYLFTLLGLALSEKQIPKITEDTEK
jgi:hypothetical protein